MAWQHGEPELDLVVVCVGVKGCAIALGVLGRTASAATSTVQIYSHSVALTPQMTP